MSNQEMQFADPDWKPSQQLNTNNNPQEQEVYTPQPVNSDNREQNKWGSAPSSLPQQEGYTGLRPYAGPVPGQMQGSSYRQRPYSRRGRGPWFWIILAFIVISLISGGSRFSSFGNGPGFDHGSFNAKPYVGPTYDYKVNGQATIIINDPIGNVTVVEGTSPSAISIQPVDLNGFPGNPNTIQQGISQNGNTITANIQAPVDLQVTVPEGANVNLQTGSGDINFTGTFAPTGTTQLQTTNGNITVNVPASSSFHLNASTNTGSITSEFPSLNIQNNASGSGQSANGVVGGNSHSQGANVVIQTNNGDITLNQK
jgi:Putative adhesin